MLFAFSRVIYVHAKGDKHTEVKNMRTLENDYRTYSELKAAFTEAEKANDEAKQTEIRKAYEDLKEAVRAEGKAYANLISLYTDMKRRGNNYIDLADSYSYQDEEALIESFRTYGIDHFTFSSSWSSAVESAWNFQEAGCKLEGLVEINGQNEIFMKAGEFEKRHAYLFRA